MSAPRIFKIQVLKSVFCWLNHSACINHRDTALQQLSPHLVIHTGTSTREAIYRAEYIVFDTPRMSIKVGKNLIEYGTTVLSTRVILVPYLYHIPIIPFGVRANDTLLHTKAFSLLCLF